MPGFLFRFLSLLPILVLPVVASADPLPFGGGERISWSVQYSGVSAGSAWSSVQAADGGRLRFTSGVRSASWYDKVFHIDDEMVSLWNPSGPGSSFYTTRFREGNFNQDQWIDISSARIHIRRKQLVKEQWKESHENVPGNGQAIEDPQSALYRIRMLPLAENSSYSFPVFTGKRVANMSVSTGSRQSMKTAIGEVNVIPVSLTTLQDDVSTRARVDLFVTDDEHRVPVKVSIRMKVGTARLTVTAYTPAPEAPEVPAAPASPASPAIEAPVEGAEK